MKQSLLIEQVLFRIPDVVSQEAADIGTIRIALNSKYQRVRSEVLLYEPDWYCKTAVLSSTSSWARSTDTTFEEVRHVEVPAAFRGSARRARHTDIENLELSNVQKGSASDPQYVVNLTEVHFYPAVTGILHYQWNFGFISDDDTEITDPNNSTLALVPSLYEEDIVNDTVEFMRERWLGIVPTAGAEEALNAYLKSELARLQMSTPQNLYAKGTST